MNQWRLNSAWFIILSNQFNIKTDCSTTANSRIAFNAIPMCSCIRKIYDHLREEEKKNERKHTVASIRVSQRWCKCSLKREKKNRNWTSVFAIYLCVCVCLWDHFSTFIFVFLDRVAVYQRSYYVLTRKVLFNRICYFASAGDMSAFLWWFDSTSLSIWKYASICLRVYVCVCASK